jgi:RimJ/RimL family protein N-acetyltransferase
MAVLVAESGEAANVNFRAERLVGERLALQPLRVEDAAELAPLLGDASEASLRERFTRQVVGVAPDGSALWLNWVVRDRRSGVALGTMQATVVGSAAELAWVVGVAHRGAGVASSAARLVVAWLGSRGVARFVAHIAPANAPSEGVARRIGMAWSGVVRDDGERRWKMDAAP